MPLKSAIEADDDEVVLTAGTELPAGTHLPPGVELPRVNVKASDSELAGQRLKKGETLQGALILSLGVNVEVKIPAGTVIPTGAA